MQFKHIKSPNHYKTLLIDPHRNAGVHSIEAKPSYQS